TDKVPIVTVTAGDLVTAGLASNLARPGGNVTGVQVLQVELATKRLALLKETIPSLRSVRLLVQLPKAEPSEGAYNQIYTPALQQYQAAARALGIALSTMTIGTAADLGDAFKARQSHVQAVVVFGNVFSYRNRAQIFDIALR